MARLRHFAVVVRDLEKSSKFYETVFGLKRVGRDDLEFGSGVYLSDGVINLGECNYFRWRASFRIPGR
jgi:catechol 2,3-dioxygenase-like lactoylglutathione lyase family enzyme